MEKEKNAKFLFDIGQKPKVRRKKMGQRLKCIKVQRL